MVPFPLWFCDNYCTVPSVTFFMIKSLKSIIKVFSWLVPRPHYYARTMRFGSRGPRTFLRPRQTRRSETNGRDPFNQNSDRSDQEKRTTSKGGPVFSKLFRLDRTDPLSFGPKFPEILVEWIAPILSLLGAEFLEAGELSITFPRR